MKKIFTVLMGVLCWMNAAIVSAAEKFDILPDLPEPLAAAQASSVSTTGDNVSSALVSQSVGQEPNILSMLVSLIFVIALIYATGIIYARLNKLGANTLKKQIGDLNSSKAAVISTTSLGGNKTLHVVELDGKRMLIGASANGIQLIKDLGAYPSIELKEGEYSKIEIPNIRIPKIEIPKIEFPNIGFTKTFSKTGEETTNREEPADDKESEFEISDIYEEEPDGIIDKLFQTTNETKNTEDEVENSHRVDPENFVLHKKYL